MNIEKIVNYVLSRVRDKGPYYADLRFINRKYMAIFTRENMLKGVNIREEEGINVRVLIDGVWGFSATNFLDEKHLDNMVENAVEMAKQTKKLKKYPFKMPERKAIKDKWKSDYQKDPFEVPVNEIVDALLALNQEALKVKNVKYISSMVNFIKEKIIFASTEGSFIEQEVLRGQMNYWPTAVLIEKGEFESISSRIPAREAGFEFFEKYLKDYDRVRKIAEDVNEKLYAKPLDEKIRDLVIHPSQLWLTIHESVGHATELDRILGYEANYAGTSFVKPDDIGKLKYASDIVNFVADKTMKNGLGTYKYDYEGTKTRKFYIVKNGILENLSMNIEYAQRIGKESNGCAYADGWSNFPIIRIPNLYLEPGKEKKTLEDLISEVDDGLLFIGDASFSIDQQRRNFQFGAELIYEIKNGKIERMVKDMVYQSYTTEFWNSVDAIGDESTFELYGTLYCGKGEPSQSAPMSHGGPVIRVRNIKTLPVGKEK